MSVYTISTTFVSC